MCFKRQKLKTKTQQLTFDQFHHLNVIRMCNKGPVNLEDSSDTMMRIFFQIGNRPNLSFYAGVYSVIDHTAQRGEM